ncbi:MAG: YdjY domain-containing protein, partial [Planctomycetota bacterium]
DLPGNWTRAFEESEIWVDAGNKHVIAGGIICMDRGPLEMFVCPLYTKEHESVIAVNARSREIHATLLALGIEPGTPVQWEPEYKAASGPKIEIDIIWKDEESGEVMTRNGREMVLNSRRKREMDIDWVFGGSQIYKDPEDGTTFYYGDAGELVCLSNFSTATMDIPINSPQDNMDLMYEANTDKIPERGTKVYVVFKPELIPAEDNDDQNEEAVTNETEVTAEDRERITRAGVNTSTIAAACKMYKLNTGQFPTELSYLVEKPEEMNVALWAGPYLQNEDSLTDPWGNALRLKLDEADVRVEVSSNGPDGEPETDDDITGS